MLIARVWNRRLVASALLIMLVALASALAYFHAKPENDTPGFLGIELAPLTRAAQARAPYLPGRGALIVKVVPKSPAALAHLASDEIVTAIDAHAVDSASDAVERLKLKKPGERVTLTYYDLARGDGRPRRAVAVLAPAPPLDTTVFTVEPPRTLAREWDFRPSMAAGASWSSGIARGPVEPLPLKRYARGACSGLAPEGWQITDAASDGTSFALVSQEARARSVFALVTVPARARVENAADAAIARLARIKPQTSPAGTTEDGDLVIDFGSSSGYAGFAITHTRPTFARGLVVSIWIAVVPASNMAELAPLAGAVALSIRCNAALADPRRPYDDAIAPTSVSVRCLKNDCDETDFAGAYNAQIHTGYVHGADQDNFLIDPRKDVWATGPNGAGTYRQVGGQLEKLDPGRTN